MTPETRLLQQVNPNWIQQGRISSQLFLPTPKDKKQLSVYDGDLIAAEASWRRFTEVLKFNSLGVVAVTVQECRDEDLAAHSDPQPNFPEHAVIDFGTCVSKGEIRRKADKLRTKAMLRGWLFQVGNEPA